MRIGVLKETRDQETRVAIVPDVVVRLVKAGHELLIEAGAGGLATFDDEAYRVAGATVTSADPIIAEADVLVRVQPPTLADVSCYRKDCVLVGFLSPLADMALVQAMAQQHITSFSMEMVPRISRAQSMDALSSMSTVSGYRAVLMAAQQLPRFFPMLVTAAGTLAPAKALILGAGVAGLQAIASARRIGAVVSAFDVRPVVKEQVESLGATFLEVSMPQDNVQDAGGYAKELGADAEKRVEELVAGAVSKMDVVITTALIPGRPAPTLITDDMVRSMRAGSVIVDLAAEAGGNCTGTKPGETTTLHGITIMGPLNLPATMPVHASQMYSRNILTVLEYLAPEGALQLDMEDEIMAGACITHQGQVVHPRLRQLLEPQVEGGAS